MIYTAILSTLKISPLNTYYSRAALTWSSFQVKREKEAETQKTAAEKRQSKIDEKQRIRDQTKASLDTPGGATQIPAGDGMEVDDGSGDDDEPLEPVAASSLLVAGQRARI